MANLPDNRSVGLWKSVDWVVIVLYLVLLVFGWISVCGASYDFSQVDLLSWSTPSGKQAIWIGCSFMLGFVLLMLEARVYDMFSYILYGGLMCLLLVTIFVAPDTKGSRSWLKFGPVSLQPAEFAKFATALALAKFMSSYNFNITRLKDFLKVLGIILLPMCLIVMQRETGSALVYFAFLLMLYREGMPGAVLFSGLSMVVYFVVGIRFETVPLWDTPTSVGEFCVLLLILLFSAGLVSSYCHKRKHVSLILYVGLGATLVSFLFSKYVLPFDITWIQIAVVVLMVGYLIYQSISERVAYYAYIAFFAVGSMAFFYSSDYVLNNVLEQHQQVRIRVLLGLEDDPTGAGYNVNQAKIAIGSGGLFGKGFLNGTQTKLKYVPEQDTDFIFCTVGEEEGFIGSAAVLVLFLCLVLRLVYLSERQPDAFGRVYGYSVTSIFLFHLFINVGMVLGITPVIGIPLPFFSYGGSSLWGFTILLFIFLRIDAARNLTKH